MEYTMVCDQSDTYMTNDTLECPACGTPNPYYAGKTHKNKVMEEISALYGVSQKILESLLNSAFLTTVCDNCIIYMNGIVDPFESLSDLKTALEDGVAMSEMHVDIAALIMDGKSQEFKYVEGVELYEIEIVTLNIYDVLRPDEIN